MQLLILKPIRVVCMISSVFILAAGVGSFVNAAKSEPVKEKLIERPVELPDRNFNILVRTVEWPVGYKSKPHTHRGPGPRYVISGKVRIDDQGKIGEYSTGESFWHEGGFDHTAENIADQASKVLIIELLPKAL